MASVRHLSKFAAIASAAVTVSGAYIVYKSSIYPARASADFTPEFQEGRLLFKPSGLRWDSNWDMYEKGTKKLQKREGGGSVDNVEECKEIKPTAIRHLLFVRHGQYLEDAKNDDDKVLTDLGRYNYLSFHHCFFIIYFYSSYRTSFGTLKDVWRIPQYNPTFTRQSAHPH